MKRNILAVLIISPLLLGTGYLAAQDQQQTKVDQFEHQLAEANANVVLSNMNPNPDEHTKNDDAMDKLAALYMKSANDRTSLLAATSLAASTTHYDRATENKGAADTSTTDLAMIQIAQNQRIIELYNGPKNLDSEMV